MSILIMKLVAQILWMRNSIQLEISIKVCNRVSRKTNSRNFRNYPQNIQLRKAEVKECSSVNICTVCLWHCPFLSEDIVNIWRGDRKVTDKVKVN